jgi:dephospho-CoA kinase
MKNSLAIGITGILGSGKTTVLEILKKIGFRTISCDEIVKELLEKKYIIKKFKMIFGTDILKNNKIDKKKVRDIIFNDLEKKKKIENILHPEVFKKIKKEILDTKKRNGIIFIEIPLLFETKSEQLFDKIMVVSAPLKEIKKRLKNKYSEEEIKNIWKNQIPLSYKKKRADYIIDNSGPISKTEKKIKEMIENLLKKDIKN